MYSLQSNTYMLTGHRIPCLLKSATYQATGRNHESGGSKIYIDDKTYATMSKLGAGCARQLSDRRTSAPDHVYTTAKNGTLMYARYVITLSMARSPQGRAFLENTIALDVF